VRVIRVWAVTMVTPAARVAEWFRGGSIGFIRNYILLKDANEENRKMREEVGRLRIENNFLRNELSTAERAQALQVFQKRRQSRMLAANVIGAVGGVNSNAVYVNRGSAEGVMRGMAVVTPDGIVGKVLATYPTASEVLLITDPDFAAGVISQKSLSRGILRGQGKTPLCKVDNVPFEEKVEVGEWFFTSGDDRVFPRGFAVGVVKVSRAGTPFKDIQVEPSGMQHGLQDVLILLETAHETIPDTPPSHQPVYIAPPPPSAPTPPAPDDPANPVAAPTAPVPQAGGTEADKLLRVYKSVGDSQNHTFGVGGPGARPPDFKNLPGTPLPAGAGPEGGRSATGPAGGQPGAPPSAPPGQGGRSSAPPAATPGQGGRSPASSAAPAPQVGGRSATGPAGGQTGAPSSATPGQGGRSAASPTLPAGQDGGRSATGPAGGQTGRSPTVTPGGRSASPSGAEAPAPKSGSGSPGRGPGGVPPE
jgi:rod shape-determining protein MreC